MLFAPDGTCDIIVVLPKAVGCGQWPFIPFTLILMSKVQCNCTMTIESV